MSMLVDPQTHDSFEFPVVGIFYRNGLPDGWLTTLVEGRLVNLVPEPDNHVDPYAVKVMIDDLHVGYVPNRGLSCPKCLIPVAHKSDVCFECGSNSIRGGLAYRLTMREAFPNNYVCFLDRLRKEEAYPLRLKVWIRDDHPLYKPATL